MEASSLSLETKESEIVEEKKERMSSFGAGEIVDYCRKMEKRMKT